MFGKAWFGPMDVFPCRESYIWKHVIFPKPGKVIKSPYADAALLTIERIVMMI